MEEIKSQTPKWWKIINHCLRAAITLLSSHARMQEGGLLSRLEENKGY
jgi:hypothetical protein